MPGDVFLLNRQRGVGLPSKATLTKSLITKKNVCFRYTKAQKKNRNKIVMVAKKKHPAKNKIGSEKSQMITRQSLLLLVTLPRGRSRSGTTHPTDFETGTSMGNVFSSLWWSSYSEWSEVPDPFAMHWWHQPFRSAAGKNTQNGSCTCSASLRSAGQLPLKSWLKSNRRNRQALNRNYPLTSLEQLSWSFLLGGASLLGLMYVFGDLDLSERSAKFSW